MNRISELRWLISYLTVHLSDAQDEVERLQGLLKGAREELQDLLEGDRK